MILDKVHRKIYKLFHPVIGEIWMLHRVVEQRSEKLGQRELEVTPEWLENKICDYQNKGYCQGAGRTLQPVGGLWPGGGP